ncbi:hypothetical protein [Sediminitomix flava]|uniref:Uncharacterized protein n=1 Tax=Sediminitomix flava TaxID=379075 RepID=A0A315ZJE7_SEDFL|nr:hypothetical protein [Sediminitomix flava]PWJ44958.1 hypothetical protein BC781_1011351 [Sediminitomix flava]
MDNSEKKAFLLLKAVILHFHGADNDDNKVLLETASQLDAQSELEWVETFISDDYLTCFERATDYLNDFMPSISPEKRVDYLYKVWLAQEKQSYVSEMVANAMLNMARDWQIIMQFVPLIKNK